MNDTGEDLLTIRIVLWRVVGPENGELGKEGERRGWRLIFKFCANPETTAPLLQHSIAWHLVRKHAPFGYLVYIHCLITMGKWYGRIKVNGASRIGHF